MPEHHGACLECGDRWAEDDEIEVCPECGSTFVVETSVQDIDSLL